MDCSRGVAHPIKANARDVETVAAAGYRAVMNQQRIVIPGTQNRLTAFATRLLPRRLITRMVRRAQERVHSNA